MASSTNGAVFYIHLVMNWLCPYRLQISLTGEYRQLIAFEFLANRMNLLPLRAKGYILRAVEVGTL